jgi:hypothetical protein
MMKRLISSNRTRFLPKLGLLKSGLPKIGLIGIALVLNACSTATLLSASIDMASFVPPVARSQTVPIPALGLSLKPLDDNDGNPNNGFLILTPISSIDIIEGFNADIALALGSSAETTVKLQLFIAPDSATDVYQAQYAVASDDKTITAGGQQDVSLKFDLQANNNLATALASVKSGKFRFGLSLGLQAASGGSFSFTLNKAVAGISGYPAKLITK